MPRDPDQFRRQKEKYLTDAVGEGKVSEQDAECIREVVYAFDESKPTTPRPEWPDAPSHLRQYRSETTLANWLYHLTMVAGHVELSEAAPFDVNEVAEKMLSGDLDGVKDGGLSKGTIRAYQNTLRIFYRYHDDLGVDAGEVAVFDRNGSGNGNGGASAVEPEDMLTRDEIQEVLKSATSYRDAAVFALALYTGMRNRALRTVRVGDVDIEDGSYRFNADVKGLKDLHEPRAKRPLFAAKGPVADWLQRHPTGDPDDYLITTNSKFVKNGDATEPVSDRTIGRICRQLKDDAGIQKPMHPHMLRHNFVYICKRVYELPDDTIKFYLGHAPDSTIMETTYSHLSAEDHFQRGLEASGEATPDEDYGFDLPQCPVCSHQLPTGAKACPGCGTVLAPDAAAHQQELQEQVEGQIPKVETEEEARVVAAVLEDLRENPDEYMG